MNEHKQLIDLLRKDLLAFGKHRGYSVEHIAFNLAHKGKSYSDEQVLKMLQDLQKLKITKSKTYRDGSIRWSLKGYDWHNWVLPVNYDPATYGKQDEHAGHLHYVYPVKYTLKGQAQITIPKTAIDQLGRPERIRFCVAQDGVRLSKI